MLKLNIHEIKNQLSKYIEMVEAGATVVVCKRNVPVAEIRPIEHKKKRIPKLGWAETLSTPRQSLKESMSKEELRLWEGGDEGDPLKKYAPKRKRVKK